MRAAALDGATSYASLELAAKTNRSLVRAFLSPARHDLRNIRVRHPHAATQAVQGVQRDGHASTCLYFQQQGIDTHFLGACSNSVLAHLNEDPFVLEARWWGVSFGLHPSVTPTRPSLWFVGPCVDVVAARVVAEGTACSDSAPRARPAQVRGGFRGMGCVRTCLWRVGRDGCGG